MLRLSMPEENGDCGTTFGNECIYQADEVNYYHFEDLGLGGIESLFVYLSDTRSQSREKENFKKTWVLKLNESIEYGDIVYLINLCLKYGFSRFQWDIYHDNFAFQEVYSKSKDPEWEEEMVGNHCVFYREDELSAYEKVKKMISEKWHINTADQKVFLIKTFMLYFFFCGIVAGTKAQRKF